MRIAPHLRTLRSARRVREDDGILAEVMKVEQFVELRKYVEFSHETLSKRLDDGFNQVDARFNQVDVRFEQVDARFDRVDARFDRVETRFDRLERKIDALGPTRRATTRRRKP